MSAPKIPAGGLQLCRLWQRHDAAGTLFLSGTMGGVRVLVVPNPDRADATDAEYVIVLAPSYPSRKPVKVNEP